VIKRTVGVEPVWGKMEMFSVESTLQVASTWDEYVPDGDHLPGWELFYFVKLSSLPTIWGDSQNNYENYMDFA